MRTIIAAIDFSDVTDALVSTATEFASALGSNVVLFHVAPAADPWVDAAFDRYTVSGPTSPHWAEVEARNRQGILDQLRDNILAAGVDVSVHLARGDDATEICNELAALQPDLIIIGSHRHGMFHDMLLVGVCPKVVRRAPCPVVVVHPGDTIPRQSNPAASKSAA